MKYQETRQRQRERNTHKHKLKALIMRALESSTKLHLYWCRVSYIIARVRWKQVARPRHSLHTHTCIPNTHTLTFPLNKLKLVCSKTSKIIKIFSLIHAHRIHRYTSKHTHTERDTDTHTCPLSHKYKQMQTATTTTTMMAGFLVSCELTQYKTQKQSAGNVSSGSGAVIATPTAAAAAATVLSSCLD